MANKKFNGLGIALITPFTQEGSVDYTALRNLVEYQINSGADFLCILATTGETPCLTDEEKLRIKQSVLDVNKGRLPVLMGCGGNNTASIVKTLKSSDFTGVDGILSVCPYYNKPTQEGMYCHFRTIAEVSPLPVVLYNVPGRTGVNIKAETTLRLARDCKNIIAIKEASGNIEQIDAILRDKPDGFDVISGDDSLTFHMIASGAVGVISVIGNALTAAFSDLVHFELEGNYAEAAQIHHDLTALYPLLVRDGNPAGVKVLLSHMGMIENVLRLPLVPATADTAQKIIAFIDNMKP